MVFRQTEKVEKHIKKMSYANSNKLIIKNALLLYGRMFLAMVVALFTSRVVLQTIGVEDYGIRGVVGSVVGIIGFLNGSLAASTSRFITYELGRQEKGAGKDILNITFNTAFTVHLILAVIVALVLETMGVWFLENKLVIPEGRLWAAHWVFHLSILSMFVGFTQIPYNAAIISHERFDIYAYVETANIFLRLGAVYLLVIGNFDKMVLYSILTTCISVGIAMYYRYFCIRHFEECHLSMKCDRGIFKRMMKFSGWNVYYNGALAARSQGVAMLVNMFFGVTVNAAIGIAGQVNHTVRGFSNNVLAAVRPQITKSFAVGEYERTRELIHYASVIILYLLSMLMLPLITEAYYILWLWLGIVPEWTVVFCRFSLVNSLLISLCYPLLTITDAAEKNKYPCLVNGTMYLMAFPISYLVFRFFHIVWFGTFYNTIAISCSFLFYNYLTGKFLPGFSMRRHYVSFFAKNVAIILCIEGILLMIHHVMPQSLLRLCVVIVSSSLMLLISGYFIAMDKEMQEKVRTGVKNYISKIRHKK